jgi:hypothetical protein
MVFPWAAKYDMLEKIKNLERHEKISPSDGYYQ